MYMDLYSPVGKIRDVEQYLGGAFNGRRESSLDVTETWYDHWSTSHSLRQLSGFGCVRLSIRKEMLINVEWASSRGGQRDHCSTALSRPTGMAARG
jgi:hypothetical protein